MAADKLVLVCMLLLVVRVNCQFSECKKIDDCSCEKKNGEIMTLHRIDGKQGPKFTGIKQYDSTSLTFSWNPCTKFSSRTACNNVLLCQLSVKGQLAYPVGQTVESFSENPDGSIILTYQAISYDAFSRKGVIILQCDNNKFPGEFTNSGFNETSATKGSQYTAIFASKCVCDGGCPPGENGSEGLSTGSILLIVFIPLIFIYFIGGLLYNKYQKGINSFPEMIPNHSFWSDLPFLVKDGCVFTFQTTSVCCSSLYMKIKGDSYAKI